jgi:hypothetical protein
MKSWIAALLFVGPWIPLVAQTGPTVLGTVIDLKGNPLAGATARLDCPVGESWSGSSDAKGYYSGGGDGGEGKCVLSVSLPGYKTLALPPRRFGMCDNIQLDVELASSRSAVPSRLATKLVPNAGGFSHVPARDPAPAPRWEYGALAQYGNGVTDNRDSFHFLMAGAHLGRILTPDVGSGIAKGNFEYAVELFPFWQSYTPKFQRANCVQAFPGGVSGTYASCTGPYTTGGTYTGASITPIILRWNFTHGMRWMPWIQGAGGVVWTDHKYPGFGIPTPTGTGGTFGPPDGANLLANDGPGTETSVWNFTPQFGVGLHYFRDPHHSIDFGANAVHISSASLGDKNPGVNASVQFNVGYTWWK